MSAIIALVADVFTMEIFQVGETSVTLGLMAVGGLVFALGIRVFKRIFGR